MCLLQIESTTHPMSKRRQRYFGDEEFLHVVQSSIRAVDGLQEEVPFGRRDPKLKGDGMYTEIEYS